MLKVNQLSKKYGELEAVKDVSFHVKKGSAFAFLGTNGAGKSTVIHMILNLLKPDNGTIIFTGGVLQEVTGVVFQTHRLDEELTIEENLLIRARLYGLKQTEAKQRVDELLRLTYLSHKRGHLYGKCSGGEKRKADIIRALVHNPSFLILDEPTTGLDAESREEIWKVLRGLQIENNLTIFLTTHYIEEAENVDYVLIMDEGKIVVEGTPEKLKSQYSKTMLKLCSSDLDGLIKMLNIYDYSFELESNHVYIVLNRSVDAIPILQQIEKYITNFSMEEASLENVFLQITEQIKNKVST